MPTLNATSLLGQFFARDYGLKADGLTDDAAPINLALFAASALGGGRVLLPSDADLILVGSTVRIPSNCELVIPPGCTLRLIAAKNVDVVANLDPVGGNTGCRVSGGGTIDGNRANQTGASIGLNLTNVTDAAVEAVTVASCYSQGVQLSACSRVQLVGVVAKDNGSHGFYLTGSTRCALVGCRAVDNCRVAAVGTADGVQLAGASTDNAVAGLVAYDSAGAAGRQGYGLREAAASGCDRNTVAALAGTANRTGDASFVGASSGTITGAAGGDLTGTYPNPTIAAGAVTAAKIAALTITDAHIAAANKDGAVGTASLRTIGTGAAQAMAGTEVAAYRAASADTAFAATDNTISMDASGAARTATLPTAVGIAGKRYTLKKSDSSANAANLATTGGQTIDGAASPYAITTAKAAITVISTGANWEIV